MNFRPHVREVRKSRCLCALHPPHHFPFSLFHFPTALSLLFSHSCALFGTFQNHNSFIFKRFRTLCTKHPGVGYPLDIPPPTSSSPCRDAAQLRPPVVQPLLAVVPPRSEHPTKDAHPERPSGAEGFADTLLRLWAVEHSNLPAFKRVTYLESTLIETPASVDSKLLIQTLSPLDAILTKNPGGGEAASWSLAISLSSSFSAPSLFHGLARLPRQCRRPSRDEFRPVPDKRALDPDRIGTGVEFPYTEKAEAGLRPSREDEDPD